MTLRKFTIISLLLGLFSCTKTETEVEKLLTNPHKKWVYLETKNVYYDRIATWYMQFNDDNTCNNRYLSTGLKYTLLDGHQEDCKWHYDEKSEIVEICGHKFHLIKYAADTIYLTNFEDRNKYWLINKEESFKRK